jgi:ubiquinone/menaquinone biosynthesis C-methylase UbiE
MKQNQSLGYQNEKFIKQEADAWYERNKSKINVPVDDEKNSHLALDFMKHFSFPENGTMVDLGGGNGRVAARFKEIYPKWDVTVLEPSLKAIENGQKLFPAVRFVLGSLTDRELLNNETFDFVLISGVLCWIDRSYLSLAVSNIDRLVKNGGHLSITDFYAIGQRANPYLHAENLYTFKQDYSAIFLSLGIYTRLIELNREHSSHSKFNSTDNFDDTFSTFLLQKDLTSRYLQK